MSEALSAVWCSQAATFLLSFAHGHVEQRDKGIPRRRRHSRADPRELCHPFLA